MDANNLLSTKVQLELSILFDSPHIQLAASIDDIRIVKHWSFSNFSMI